LHLAEARAFEPVWSEAIHAEWMANLNTSMGIPADRIEYRRGEMERAFPAASVSIASPLVSTIQGMCKTPAQRKDAHVVAVAVKGKASLIVTHNIKDFSAQVLSHYHISKVRPDPFCVDLLATRQIQVIEGARTHRASLKRTPMTPVQYVDYLADDKLGMPKFAQALAPHLGII
jgi:PIN domain